MLKYRSKLIRSILASDFVNIAIDEISVQEDVNGVATVASAKLSSGYTIEGRGNGVINALFKGFLNYYADEYVSLKTLEIVSLHVNLKSDTKKEKSGTDAKCEIQIGVRNHIGKVFYFSYSSGSLLSAAALSITSAVEFFVNSEKAFVVLQRALEDAKSRDRLDLVTIYTRQLSDIVKNTSYTGVVEE